MKKKYLGENFFLQSALLDGAKKRYTVYNMKRYLRRFAMQALPVIITALTAAGLAFAQSFSASAGWCPAPVLTPTEVGGLGAIMKVGHQAFMALIFNKA